MSKFIIQGGIPLRGEVRVSGSKNSALPILAATLLTNQECQISNVPDISDIQVMLEILKKLGAQIERQGNKVKISAKNITNFKPDPTLVIQMRASVLLLGALLGRSNKVVLAHPGGCLIGPRPIDIHLDAVRKLGAEVKVRKGLYYITAKRLRGSKIVPRGLSVTATENILMASVLASGKTVIKLAACEPEVEDLAKFLKKMGAKIRGEGTHCLEVEGVGKLYGAKHNVIPDRIEAATYIIAGAATGGDVVVKDLNPDHLESFLNKLEEIGVKFNVGRNYVHVLPSERLRPGEIKTAPYPGFATDYQAPLAVLLTKAWGKSIIFETIFEERLNYLQELAKMGARVKILNPHEAEIIGPSKLQGTRLTTYDLRAGATLILAALSAKGVSEIEGIEIIDRGYENIERKLVSLGAKIERVNSKQREKKNVCQKNWY